MIESKDIKVDEDGDFVISSDGDFIFEDERDELLYSLVDSVTGDYKLNPTIGINLKTYLNGAGSTALNDLKINLKQQMQNDNFDTSDLNVTFDRSNNKIDIKTNFIRIKA